MKTGYYATFYPELQTCSAVERGSKTFFSYIFCSQMALGDKLNFSHVRISGLGDSNPHSFQYKMNYNMLQNKYGFEQSYLFPAYARDSYVTYCGQKNYFKMATVSLSKLKLEGLQALVMPLDLYTWSACIVCFTLVAIFLSRIGIKEGGKNKTSIFNFIQYWQWILSCLSAQYHGTPNVLRLLPNFPIFVIICVLSFYLLGTVFYQGSMYSSLVAVSPPDIPSTLESVVDSKIQIITTSSSVDPEDTSRRISLLKYITNEDVNNITINSTRLLHILMKFKEMPNFIYSEPESHFVVGLDISARNDIHFENNVFKQVMDTFAIINLDYELDNFFSGIKVKNNPYINRHIEEPIFFLEMPISITRGFISSAIIEGFGQLEQSGIYRLWLDLGIKKAFMENILDKTSKNVYREAVLMRFFGARENIVFEEGKQVPLSALLGVLWLCAGILGVAIVTFIREVVTYEMLIYLGKKFRSTATKVVIFVKLVISRSADVFCGSW